MMSALAGEELLAGYWAEVSQRKLPDRSLPVYTILGHSNSSRVTLFSALEPILSIQTQSAQEKIEQP